jgi:hypothetical protein
MKEYAAAQAELGDASSSSSSVPSLLVADVDAVTEGGDELFGDAAELAAQARAENKERRRKGANPDLLELRPYDAEGEDLFDWVAVIRGPEGGSYQGE